MVEARECGVSHSRDDMSAYSTEMCQTLLKRTLKMVTVVRNGQGGIHTASTNETLDTENAVPWLPWHMKEENYWCGAHTSQLR